MDEDEFFYQVSMGADPDELLEDLMREGDDYIFDQLDDEEFE